MADVTLQPTAADISVWIERLSRQPPSRRTSSPDLLLQLQQTLRRPVDRLLCVAADPDPSLRILSATLVDHPADVRRGIELIEQMTGRRAKLIEPGYARRNPYPALHPSKLIRRQFGRKLRPHRQPTDVGVLLFDSITAAELAAIERTHTFDLPLVIDDHTTGRRHRLAVPASTTLEAALAAAGLAWQSATLFEGPLLQKREVALSKTVGETDLWLHLEASLGPILSTACTRCGDCVHSCPVDLHPAALLEAAQADDREMGHAFSAAACIECGLCTQVCPSRLPIMESIREFKRLGNDRLAGAGQ